MSHRNSSSPERSASSWPWPEALDAVTAAPRHHVPLFENDRVRVLDTNIRPGERTAVHTHRWPMTMYVISWSDFVRYDGDGTITHDTRQAESPAPPSAAFWTEPLGPHSLENLGTSDLHIISVELKR